MFKKGLATLVILLFLGLAVSPTIYADNKMSLDPVPDLECYGELDFVEVEPNATVSGTITVENIGEDGSELNWEIESFPDWGVWTFDPENGTGLLAGDTIDISIDIVVPDPLPDEFEGEVVIVNSNDSSDFCIVPISCPINQYYISSIDYYGYTPIQLVFLLINKLRYYEGIESEEDVLEIIEGDEELSGIVEEFKSFDCGCEKEVKLVGPFPIRCLLMFPVFLFGLVLYITTGLYVLLGNVRIIGLSLNCWWAF